MKFLFLFMLMSSLAYGQLNDYSGEWKDIGNNYENTLILEKINSKKDTYRFKFFAWRISYDRFTEEEVKFGGQMKDEIFTIQIENSKASYDDDVRNFKDEEFSIYNENEERCKVYFFFNDNSIVVELEDCTGIYSGYGVSFAGIYKKTKN